MKKHILIISLFAVCFFTACEKPKNPTTPIGNEPVPTENTNPLYSYLAGEWECLIFLNDRSFKEDTVVLTRTFHSSEKKFYQTVQSDSNVDPRNRLQFGGTSGWNDYDLREDTLYLQKSDGQFHYDETSSSYILYRLSTDTMGMSYRGGLLANMKRSYLFIRKKQ